MFVVRWWSIIKAGEKVGVAFTSDGKEDKELAVRLNKTNAGTPAFIVQSSLNVSLSKNQNFRCLSHCLSPFSSWSLSSNSDRKNTITSIRARNKIFTKNRSRRNAWQNITPATPRSNNFFDHRLATPPAWVWTHDLFAAPHWETYKIVFFLLTHNYGIFFLF